MIARSIDVAGRRAWVFTRDEVSVAPDRLRALVEGDADDDDRARLALLRRLLAQRIVRGTAHPGVDPSDVIHVYLDGGVDGPVFASVLATEERVRAMLEEAPFVVEGLSFQVVPGARLSGDAVRAALEAWAERNVPGVPVPRFAIAPWVDPSELPPDVADVPGRLDEDLPAEWTRLASPVQESALEETGWR